MAYPRPYGPLRPDLTPLDLYAAGFVLRHHSDGVRWVHWRKNPYDPKGEGEIYSGLSAQPEGAIADARRLLAAWAERAGGQACPAQTEAIQLRLGPGMPLGVAG